MILLATLMLFLLNGWILLYSLRKWEDYKETERKKYYDFEKKIFTHLGQEVADLRKSLEKKISTPKPQKKTSQRKIVKLARPKTKRSC